MLSTLPAHQQSSDGIMTTLNAYDNQIYAWGKGPSEMTVTAPNIELQLGTPIRL